MKKLAYIFSAFILVGFLFSVSVQAQTNIFPTSGNVGIGTTTPSQLLNVYNPSAFAIAQVERPLASGIGNVAAVYAKNSTSGEIYYFGLKKVAVGHEGVQSVYYPATNTWRAFSAINTETGKYEIRSGVGVTEFKNTGDVLFNNEGNIGIGLGAIAMPSGVKLAVNGKVACKEVEVTLSYWPDHVFKTGYDLMPLQEVESFISLNKHLPGVPSESDVLQKGNNLGEMDAILLQKIEELTLYMIDLKKDNEKMKAQIEKLK